MRDPFTLRPLYAPWKPAPSTCPKCGATLYLWNAPARGIKIRLVCSKIGCPYYREKFSDGTINSSLPAEIRRLDTQGGYYDPVEARQALADYQSSRSHRKGSRQRHALLRPTPP